MAASSAAHQHAHAHAHAHGDALAKSRGDPTKTKTLRKRYSQKLRGRFADINTEIRAGIRDRAVLNLDGDALADALPSSFPARRDRQVETFDTWLKRQQEKGVLNVISRDGNQYVQSAYSRGLKHAATELRKQGVDVPDEELERVFNRPIHRDTLQLLYTSDYSDLEGITAEVSKQANRTLTRGFSQGWGPDKIARELTDRVDKIGKTRATTLARTSVIDAHSTATLNRYEELGTKRVTIKSEFMTAGDRRVCALCNSIEDTTYTIQEARTETFEYQASAAESDSLSGEYPVKPPIHPRCRCVWLPVLT